MNRNLLKKIAATSILFSNLAFAGTEVGNGGDVIVCMNGPVETVEFFDTYEARVLRGWTTDLGSSQLSVREKVDLALSRLELTNTYSLSLAAELKTHAADFWTNSAFVPNTELTDITDTFAITIPSNCKLKQLAIQRLKPSLFDKRYIVNKDLWNKMTTDDQAALILHEIIYKKAIQQGATNSIGTRLINSILFSNMISNIDVNLWIEAWREADFKSIKIGVLGIEMDLRSNLKVNNNGYIEGKVAPYFFTQNVNINNLLIRLSEDNLEFSSTTYKISQNKIQTRINSLRSYNSNKTNYHDYEFPNNQNIQLEINNNSFCLASVRMLIGHFEVIKTDESSVTTTYIVRFQKKLCFDENGNEVNI